MLLLKIVNKLLKKTKHYAKKSGSPFFVTVAARLENKKKALIFSELDKLAVTPDVQQSAGQEITKRIIWICWFQGLEQAPPLVRRCIESVQRNANGAEVVILTDASIRTWLDLPAHIIEKYDAELISKAHYSDIVRCALLYQYGGIWMDATLFLTRPVPESFYIHEFSSLRYDVLPQDYSISLGNWTIFLFAAQINSAFMKFVRDALYAYWRSNDAMIEYFFTDYTLLYAVEKHPQFAALIRNQPIIGNDRYLIRQFINKPVNSETRQALQNDPTGIYKLSHKEKYQTEHNGVETLYSKILHGDFDLNG